MSRTAIAAAVAARVKTASFIREMFEKGRRLRAEFGDANVFDFSLGNPTATPPSAFFEALRAVAAEKNTELHRYMPNAGFDDTRAAVAKFLSRQYRLQLDAGSIIMTSGAAGGLNVTLRAICDPGDEIILLAPYFPEYLPYVDQAGARSVIVDTDAVFQPDAEKLAAAITPRTRGVIVNSPNNPTGAVYSDAACRAMAEAVRQHDRDDAPIYLITDDPYRRILYGRTDCPSVAAHYHRTIIISSYSKDLSIPGERAGYIAVPPGVSSRGELLGAMTMLNRTLGFVNMSAFMQRVIARCADACCDSSTYQANRDLLCRALRDFGYELNEPGGALYAFPKTPIPDDAAFVELLLRERVLVVPGRGFGRPGHIRISFAVEPETLERGLEGFRKAARAARG